MEALKRIILTFLSVLSVSILNAQSDAQIHAAFAESYKAELTGNYIIGVSEINSIYQADSYQTNARLGWLLLLAKQYTESINYYEKAVKL